MSNRIDELAIVCSMECQFWGLIPKSLVEPLPNFSRKEFSHRCDLKDSYRAFWLGQPYFLTSKNNEVTAYRQHLTELVKEI